MIPPNYVATLRESIGGYPSAHIGAVVTEFCRYDTVSRVVLTPYVLQRVKKTTPADGRCSAASAAQRAAARTLHRHECHAQQRSRL